MDRVDWIEAYRARTLCTLYTLKCICISIHEVKKTDVVDVSVRILGTDASAFMLRWYEMLTLPGSGGDRRDHAVCMCIRVMSRKRRRFRRR